jgi:hypothetical protein
LSAPKGIIQAASGKLNFFGFIGKIPEVTLRKFGPASYVLLALNKLSAAGNEGPLASKQNF